MNARCCWPPDSVGQRPVGLRGQSDALDRLVRRLRGRSRRSAAEEARSAHAPGGDELAHRQRARRRRLRALGEVADPRADAVLAAARRERAFPLVGSLETEDEPEQRRLAAAVRSGDRDELATLYLEATSRRTAGRARTRTTTCSSRALAASERLSQRGEVRGASARSTSWPRSVGVSPRSGRALPCARRPRARPSRPARGETSRSKKTVVACVSADDSTTSAQSCGAGSASGVEAGDRHLSQP